MDRQTRSVIAHPNRGECTLVYRNGPSFLVLDDGSQVPLEHAPHETFRSGNGAWMSFCDPVHGDLETRVLKAGEVHRRRIHTLLGIGWLVYEADGFWMRFEPDAGQSFRFEWVQISVGTPDYVRRADKRRSKEEPITPEEEMWTTHKTTTGEVHAFRREGEPKATTRSAPQAKPRKGAVRDLPGVR